MSVVVRGEIFIWFLCGFWGFKFRFLGFYFKCFYLNTYFFGLWKFLFFVNVFLVRD